MDPALINAILDGPALAPPKGVVPNFENPQNLRNPELAVLQLAAATVVVALRVYTKMVVVGKMLTEDCKTFHPSLKRYLSRNPRLRKRLDQFR